jgi:four helix bundle protein
VHKASLEFPKIEQYALADQIRRASKSICANLAEGFGKQSASSAEFKRFVSISVGSASEMQVWCEYALALGYIDQRIFDVWHEGYDHIIKMLQRLKA